MKTYKFFLPLLILTIVGCKPVSMEEISMDRGIVQKQIAQSEKESFSYEGSAAGALLKLRLETLKHTDDMLAQKMTGINRFININYSIDGKSYLRPTNYEEQLKSIDADTKLIQQKIDNLQKESQQYNGGILQGMLLMQIETQKLTLAMLDQKRLGILYEFPVYFNPEVSAEMKKEESRTAMNGSVDANL